MTPTKCTEACRGQGKESFLCSTQYVLQLLNFLVRLEMNLVKAELGKKQFT